ncbi:MAG: hypothetical protein KGD63_01990 [Candidatus Lokiarchaeota archaeon]|nr:hypothetical protein [Candidatus Lokiarchaeota archaeon]
MLKKKGRNKIYSILVISFLFCTTSFVFFFPTLESIPNNSMKTSVSTSEKYGIIEVKGGEYIVQNNVWGADTLQEITVPDTNVASFTVSQSQHDQGSVAAYPSIFKGDHWGIVSSGWTSYRVSDISSASYSWSVDNYRPSGTYNVVAEAWFSAATDGSLGYNDGCELMIYLDSRGMVPGGSPVGTFGQYEVWYGWIGWHFVSYFQTGQNSANINLLDFMNDAISRGYLDPSWYYHAMEAGFELMSGGAGLTLNSFSASVSTDQINDPPSLNSPSDISYIEGDTGNSITWTATDDNPTAYTITRNGQQVASNSWSSGSAIIINVDGLLDGTYTYVCTVSDGDGLTDSDTVILTVTSIDIWQNGDVNHDGEVDIVDALLISQYYVGLDPQPFYEEEADVNGDGSIDIIDALLVAQAYVGLIDLPT